ncbi:hypothetical protein DD238_008467 [Peronospora effusa]|uniref:Uncharacterized protein n=1 Tax=Peronospora effusa TaxID=542832 RepID=A0A3M6VRA4_9STRA|nr:hypothetical protein DD238_008467 [Peronospora effusa]
MDAEVSTAEGSMAFMESLTVLQRLFKVSEEIQRRIDKRNALQTPNVAKDAKIGIQKAQNEESIDNEEENRLTKRDAAALAQKKELKELRAREKKQQRAAKNLKQLQAKRKREEEESDEQLRKLAHVEASNTVKEADAGHLCLFAGHLFA